MFHMSEWGWTPVPPDDTLEIKVLHICGMECAQKAMTKAMQESPKTQETPK
jgi:hypothetical protein